MTAKRVPFHDPQVPWSRPLVVVGMLTGLAGTSPSLALRNVDADDQAPPFSVTSPDDQTIDKEELRGKVLLLIFLRAKQEPSLAALKVAYTS